MKKTANHPSGIAHIPALHVDEIGMTSDKYIPLNETVKALPLSISFDRSDIHDDHRGTTATAGPISPARWRLLTHLSKSIESQRELGFEQSDIDDLRRLIADTNVTLLGITVLASALHMLFEFLTFKNEVSFWQNNSDLTGLSVRCVLFLHSFHSRREKTSQHLFLSYVSFDIISLACCYRTIPIQGHFFWIFSVNL